MDSEVTPRVSIVTPSYNSADFLAQAIGSVQNQSYPNIQHLIIDGQSTDATPDILRRAGPPVEWVSEPDQGQADALNKGFALAAGEIIGWLNADDTYAPGTISAAVEYLQRHPQVDLVYGNFNFIDEQGQIIHAHTAAPFSLEKLLYAAIIPQASMFFRRRVLDELGGVNSALHYVLDWEFTFRIARRYNVACAPRFWGNFRITPGTKSVRQPEQFWPEWIPILQQAVSEDAARFHHWGDDALFMAHLLAGLEFARSNMPDPAQKYVGRAFEILPGSARHPAVLASGLYKTAMFPWHSAFRPHPLARQALDNLSQCLTDTPLKREILGYLNLCRVFKLVRQGKCGEMRGYVTQAGHLIGRKSFYHWRTARMLLGAMIKPWREHVLEDIDEFS